MNRTSLSFACALAIVAPIALTSTASAGDVEIVAASAKSGSGGWRFDVTLLHEDEGWDHYADRWEVLGPDGTILGTRTLLHPHENEQPFTRSLSGVEIPEGIDYVLIRAMTRSMATGRSCFG